MREELKNVGQCTLAAQRCIGLQVGSPVVTGTLKKPKDKPYKQGFM